MKNTNNKHRLNIEMDENTYIVEIALRLFFREIMNGKSISELMIETGIIGDDE